MPIKATNRRYDLNGWFEIPDQPISRVGVFDYHGSQLGPDCPDKTRMYKVLRPAEELSNPEALDSFRLVPFINDHTMLGRRGKAAESVGVHGVTGDNVYFDASDGDGVMKSNVKVFSTGLAGKIDAGKKDLSLGYGCSYDWTPGVFKGQAYDCIQRTPRGNHIALVKAGRMGSQVAVLDQLTFTMDAEDFTPMFKTALDKARKAAEEAKAKGASAEVVAACDAAVAELEAAQAAFDAAAGSDDDEMSEDAKAAIAKANEAKDAAEAAAKVATDALDVANAELAKLKKAKTKETQAADTAALDELRAQNVALAAEVKTLKETPVMDEAAMFAAVGRRDALVVKLRPFIGAFDHAPMTLDQVAAYGVEKLGLKDVTKGHELTALDAYLAAKPERKPVTTGTTAGDGADAGKAATAINDYAGA